MTRIEYMTALNQYLVTMSASEKAAILSDYEKHFRRGLEAGKTEAQISASLGTPYDVATELLAGRRPPVPTYPPRPQAAADSSYIGQTHTHAAQPRPQTAAQPRPQTAAQPRPQTTAQPRPQTTAQPRPQTTAQPRPQTAAQPRPQTAAQPRPQTTVQPRPQTTAQPRPQTAAQPRPQTAAQPRPQPQQIFTESAYPQPQQQIFTEPTYPQPQQQIFTEPTYPQPQQPVYTEPTYAQPRPQTYSQPTYTQAPQPRQTYTEPGYPARTETGYAAHPQSSQAYVDYDRAAAEKEPEPKKKKHESKYSTTGIIVVTVICVVLGVILVPSLYYLIRGIYELLRAFPGTGIALITAGGSLSANNLWICLGLIFIGISFLALTGLLVMAIIEITRLAIKLFKYVYKECKKMIKEGSF